MAKISTAEASPTKSFFVRMITRDITLEDCILDLIDNSIDSAWGLEGGRPTGLNEDADLSKYIIDINIQENAFSILDNCGGMSLKDAESYAFTFGRKESDNYDSFSIGVYGIGMKRAIFKIGSNIEIKSTYTDEGSIKAFRVPIDVHEWTSSANEGDWDFTIYSAKKLPSPGVRISITDLTEDTASAFASPLFERDLRRIIARDYMFHMHYGLQISMNGRIIDGWSIELRDSADIQPTRTAYVDSSDPRGDVHVEIISGMATPPPETNEPEDATGDDRFGWYIVCNGRVVLAGDKTAVSGWGTNGWPQWHGQYNGFIGIIMFSAADAALLPLTTTKRSVNTTSGVFRRSQPRMRELSKAWTDYTNARKNALDEARALESAAKSKPIFSLPMREASAYVQYKPKPKVPVANIAYTIPKVRVQKLAAALGNINMSYRELGLKTFELAYDDNVGAD